MTTAEFSDTFDSLLNSFNTQASFGEQSSHQDIVLDEYEKSVFLTQAQDIVVKSYFDRTLNAEGQGFDDSSKRQIDFSSLITVVSAEEYTPVEGDDGYTPTTYDPRGILFKLPTNVLVTLNEKVEVRDTGKKLKSIFVIVPINYKEYDRQMSKAYTQPLKKQGWRLFQTEGVGIDVISEIIPIEGVIGADDTINYKIRYIRRPKPIILQDFSQDTTDNVSIDNVRIKTECELNPIIHMDILNKAVELAIISKGGGSAEAIRQSQAVNNNRR